MTGMDMVSILKLLISRSC